MNRFYYSDPIDIFCKSNPESIIAKLVMANQFALEQTQRDAWLQQILILQPLLASFQGVIYFEYSIPRMGRRIDVLLLIKQVIFVLEFKVGENEFTSFAEDQVMDYSLDLKNFHEKSHDKYIAPILIATQAKDVMPVVSTTPHNDKLLFPIRSNQESVLKIIRDVLAFSSGMDIDSIAWEGGRYCPTPTIIEAAMALYSGHAVEEISRNDAAAINLTKTSKAIAKIIQKSKENSEKSICFVTGVPGAGNDPTPILNHP